MTSPEAITLETLADAPARHAFFTRRGGVSEGLFASLNCGFGSGDDRARVAANRARAAAHIGVAPDRLVTCHQVHGTEVITVEQPWRYDEAPRADAMVTKTPGVALGVLAADCAPVLFVDPEAGIAGAAHGGWKGALAGVVEATVAAMLQLGARADRIRAGIGPCIGQSSYEVGPEFRDRFAAAALDNDCFFVAATRPGHFRFDLPGYLAARLQRLGLATVADAAADTAADETRFFSYRRACLQGERDYGRLLAAITLPA